MIKLFKSFFQRPKTEWDIEGRCECCGIRLDLIITVVSRNEIRILAIPCKDHPKDTMILWPLRDDIKSDQTKYIQMLDKSSNVQNLIYKYYPNYGPIMCERCRHNPCECNLINLSVQNEN